MIFNGKKLYNFTSVDRLFQSIHSSFTTRNKGVKRLDFDLWRQIFWYIIIKEKTKFVTHENHDVNEACAFLLNHLT